MAMRSLLMYGLQTRIETVYLYDHLGGTKRSGRVVSTDRDLYRKVCLFGATVVTML